MRTYKTYLVLVFVPYIALVVMFHTQLPLYDASSSVDGEVNQMPEEAAGERSHHLRDLQADSAPSTPGLNLSTKVRPVVAPRTTKPQPPLNASGQHPASMAFPAPAECKQNGSLQYQSLGSHFIYSAYWDDRQEVTYVRVIALLRKNDKPAIHCHLPWRIQNGSVVNYTIKAEYYEMCENHAKDFGGWILSCPVPKMASPPCHIVISLSPDHQGQEVTVPIFMTRPAENSTRRDFAVCVPPLFGHIPSTTLVEFIELTQVLGGQHFTFYLHEASLEMTRVLDFYQHHGVITVVPWELPVPPRSLWYHGQLLAINDCLYRSMHAFRYVAFNDIDEFVVPHSRNSWASMVQHLLEHVLEPKQEEGEEQHSFCGFTFQSAFFDPMLMGSPGSRVLYDLESDLRTKHLSRVRTKAMVDPSRIFELGIHHISKPLLDHYRPYYVDPSDAFLHHYRKCITDFDPRMNCQVYKQDQSLSRYIPTLRHNVHHTLWTLKELDRHSRGGAEAQNPQLTIKQSHVRGLL